MESSHDATMEICCVVVLWKAETRTFRHVHLRWLKFVGSLPTKVYLYPVYAPQG
jgi:hypothetical protein